MKEQGRMKGGKLNVSKIKAFLEASYDVNDTNKNIHGYELDTEISNKWGKVFVNQLSRKVVIAHRGTRSTTDWANNAVMALGAYQLTDRYKTGASLQQAAEFKYNGYKIYTIGHSQAGQLVHLLGKNTTGISLNPAYMTPLKGEFQGKNEFVIRASFDPVSSLTKGMQNAALSIMNPGYNARNNIVIKSTTSDPLQEHAITVLDRLPQDMLIGRGKSNITYKINKDILKQYKNI